MSAGGSTILRSPGFNASFADGAINALLRKIPAGRLAWAPLRLRAWIHASPTGGSNARLISDLWLDCRYPLRRFRTGGRPRPWRVVCPHECGRGPCLGELRFSFDRGLPPLGDRRQSWFLQPEPCIQETTAVRTLRRSAENAVVSVRRVVTLAHALVQFRRADQWHERIR